MTDNKHANQSAQTRERFITAAQQLFAERGVDSVSLNEITAAAGQKNRNALQYHFGGRDGLLQAIVDQHAGEVLRLRDDFLRTLDRDQYSAAEATARGLLVPLMRYIERDPSAIHYVVILSQLAASNSAIVNPTHKNRLSFQEGGEIATLTEEALAHLKPAEAQRRLFLVVSALFHGLADICRIAESEDAARPLRQRGPLFEQLICQIEALLAAPARE